MYLNIKNKKVFVISDIHGNYDEMIKALYTSGYSPENSNHLLIVLGDLFDRGNKSLEVYEYLYPLWKKGKCIITKGNHETMLKDYLTGGTHYHELMFNMSHNGLKTTINSLLRRDTEEHIKLRNFSRYREVLNERYPLLTQFLMGLPDYVETEDYIFTHGSIDDTVDDWREGHWLECHWSESLIFTKDAHNITSKTVVIGHSNTFRIREDYKEFCDVAALESSNHDIVINKTKSVIAIDTCSIVSGFIGVLVIEDNTRTFYNNPS